jgi:hypothetical protein
MMDIQNLAQRYIASWNEPDAATRRQLIDGLWTEDARYADPMMQADGKDGIAALIANVHTQFPGHRFMLTGKADGHGPFIRFSWSLAPAEDPGDRPMGYSPTGPSRAVARGTDFAALAVDGRLAQVTGFLDKPLDAA